MRADIDFKTHPDFIQDNSFETDYVTAINHLGFAFDKTRTDLNEQLKSVEKELEKFDFKLYNHEFQKGGSYSLRKEFFYDVIACNIAAKARILCRQNKDYEAREFVLSEYQRAFKAGLCRGEDFFINRLDSRTLMPMRRIIDESYLDAIGLKDRTDIFLCTGDCQTMMTAEMVHDRTPNRPFKFFTYQHRLGSLIDSGLDRFFQVCGYMFFVNITTDYIFFAKSVEDRQTYLDLAHVITDWLKKQSPEASIFVTGVYPGLDRAMRTFKHDRSLMEDAIGPFTDEVNEILSQAPNSKLIDFRKISPLTWGGAPFRDRPDGKNFLHFNFDIMNKVADKVSDNI